MSDKTLGIFTVMWIVIMFLWLGIMVYNGEINTIWSIQLDIFKLQFQGFTHYWFPAITFALLRQAYIYRRE